jgi:hypothetical protein
MEESMSTKERIQEVIDGVAEENLDELYEVLRSFAASRNGRKGPGIMERLKRAKIQAPVDFATNLDQYTSGEKRVEDNLP